MYLQVKKTKCPVRYTCPVNYSTGGMVDYGQLWLYVPSVTVDYVQWRVFSSIQMLF